MGTGGPWGWAHDGPPNEAENESHRSPAQRKGEISSSECWAGLARQVVSTLFQEAFKLRLEESLPGLPQSMGR